MKRIRLKVQGNGAAARIKAVEVDNQNTEIPQGGGNVTAIPKEGIRWINREQDMVNVDFVVRFVDLASHTPGWPFVESPTAPNNGLRVPKPFGTDVKVTLKQGAAPNWKYVVSLDPESGIDPLDPMIIIRGGKQFSTIQFALATIGGVVAGAIATILILKSGLGMGG